MAEREIKYRGLKTFQIFSGEIKQVWIYGFYLKRGTYGDPGPQAHIFVYENGYEGYRVDSKTIGQFTGFFDRDDNEIYEDDIVSIEDDKIGVIDFFRGAFVIRIGKEKIPKFLADIRKWQLKILGNRFENPELLNEISKSQLPKIKKKKGIK